MTEGWHARPARLELPDLVRPGSNPRGSNYTLLIYPSIDAIAEFKTIRNTYSAEFGRSASGQINLVTRSGTNQLHGDLHEFNRGDYDAANSYSNNLSGLKRPPFTTTTTATPSAGRFGHP